MKISSFKCLLYGAGIFFVACTSPQRERQGQETMFRSLSADSTGVSFRNDLTEGLNTNVLLYEYFYNGGGVGVGDFNGDGLQDLYFSANMSANKLYLNKGAMHFQDVTAAAGAEGREGPWKTGVAVADVNADGRPDILLSYSGKVPGYKRVKQLFINMGNDASGVPHFEDQAAVFGLADTAYTTQVYFFDYDLDGDLDMFELNHNPKSLPVLNEMLTAELEKKDDPASGSRLYRNDNGHFVDVTVASGINHSSLSYGLGAGIADIDGDGWPDIYVSNDYTIPDYYYVNDHKGHFVDKLGERMGHTSQFSMGNNVADMNNDGLPDIYTLDMLPEDNRRQKLLFAPDNYEKFDLTVRSGFGYQYMRNMLQLNNGDGHFSEIGQIAGISNTDWSWAPLWADFDNDGWKDLFVTNGYVRDYTNMDFIKFMEGYTQEKGRLHREDVLDIISHMPSSNVTSYIFRNRGDLTMENTGARWGIEKPSNSNGAAWADLDNDGDLDLVVNNINQPAFIYENRARRMVRGHFLELRLAGSGGNTQGVGAKVRLYAHGGLQYQEQRPIQGYQSSVTPLLHFGLGKDSVIDSLRVDWPGGRSQVLHGVKGDQVLVLSQASASPEATSVDMKVAGYFEEEASPIPFKHISSAGNDFKRQPMLINPLSYGGPCMTKADVNGDGLEDVYVGAGDGQASVLYLQQRVGIWKAAAVPAFEADRAYGDAGAVFFDANGDGHMDLYVASGGYHHFQADDSLLQDRLYIGDGKGHFTKDPAALPVMRAGKGCARVADINGDGYADIFVGGRNIPGQYPTTPSSFLLINDGKGHFADRTDALAPGLQKAGMVTDAAWADMNGDDKPDLVVVGEWMPVMVWVNQGNGKLVDKTTDLLGRRMTGWWNAVCVRDLDGDGRPDIVAGNLGLNAQCKADSSHPAELYFKDFDGNGTIDPILCFYIGDTSYPYITRDELTAQVGNRIKRFPTYAAYAKAGLKDMFSPEELAGAQHLEATCLRTVCLVSGGGRYHEVPLPIQAQFAPVFTITELGHDLLLCGNINHGRLRMGKYDANYGVLLRGDGKGGFSYVPQPQSGLHLTEDVRSVVELGDLLLFGVNGEPLRAYRPRRNRL